MAASVLAALVPPLLPLPLPLPPPLPAAAAAAAAADRDVDALSSDDDESPTNKPMHSTEWVKGNYRSEQVSE